MNFNMQDLQKSSFKDFEFGTKKTNLSGGKRLSTHNFINAGNETEENGLAEKVFSITAYITGDGYIQKKKDFIKILDSKGAGTLVDMFYGTQEVQVDKYSTSEDVSALGIVTFDITFKLEKNEVTEEDLIVYNVDYTDKVTNNFKANYNPNLGDDMMSRFNEGVTDILSEVNDSMKFLESTREFASEVMGVISNVKQGVSSIAAFDVINEIRSITDPFKNILKIQLFNPKEQKQITNSVRTSLQKSTAQTFDNEIDKTTHQNIKAYNICMNSLLLQTCIKSLEHVEFSTGDDFGDLKDDVLSSFDILENEIETNEDDNIEKIQARQEILDAYALSRKEFIIFYTQKYSKVQNLKEDTFEQTTNVLDIALNKYHNLDRIDEIIGNNDIIDPIFISGNIKLLDR